MGAIERQLPPASLALWQARSAADYLVLYDWRCSAGSLQPRTPLAALKDALFKVSRLLQVLCVELMCDQ